LRQAGFNILPGDAGVGERPGEIRPTELESAVFALPAGQVGGPIEVGGGFHVIKVIEQTPSSVKQFGSAETQKEIRDKLQNLLAQKEYHRVVEEMKSEAVIQRLE
jgi:parvulin-like peptidyl-prolyl isomerase